MNLLAKGFGVTGITAINLDRDWLALTVGQQSHHDLFLTFLAVAIIAPSGQRVIVTLQIPAGYIVEKELVLGGRGGRARDAVRRPRGDLPARCHWHRDRLR